MSIPVDDRGLLLGDGLFETLLWSKGRLSLFDAHFARLKRGCEALGLPAPELGRVRYACLAEIETAGLRDQRAAVRVTWTAGSGGRGLERPHTLAPRLVVSAAPAGDGFGPAALETVGLRRNETSPLSRFKTLAYLDNVLARRQARELGADEALMLNTRGEVAGGAAGNLFWFEGDRLVTPALDCGVLEGVVRVEVLRAARDLGVETAEAHAGYETVAGARGLFLTNSLLGLRPVSRLDGREVVRHGLVDVLTDRLASMI